MAVGTVAIALEGVLQAESGGAVIPAGRAMYGGLAKAYSIAVVSDLDPEKALHWLKVNEFDQHSYFVPSEPTDPEGIGERRVLQLQRLRAFGCDVQFLVDCNPEIARSVYLNGFPCMLYLSPQYLRPEHRPDFSGEIKPWDEMVDEVDRVIEIRTSDSRPGHETL